MWGAGRKRRRSCLDGLEMNSVQGPLMEILFSRRVFFSEKFVRKTPTADSSLTFPSRIHLSSTDTKICKQFSPKATLAYDVYLHFGGC